MDHTTVNYTITNFNEAEKQLDVIFDDGGWAKIQLKAPLPSTQEELEIIIKQFTSPQEVIKGKSDTTDLSFISSLVNQSIQTTRISNTPPPLPPGVSTTPPTPNQIKNMQLRQQHSLAEQLVAFGVLNKNPVDLSQIVEDPGVPAQPISVGTQTL
jgi:hypothetical protein